MGRLHGGFAHYTVVSLSGYELSLAINRDAFMHLYSHKVYRSWEGVLVTERRVAGGNLFFITVPIFEFLHMKIRHYFCVLFCKERM